MFRERRDGRDPSDADFTEYVVARATHLREVAYLICGDWHRAQDLTQIALAKLYVAWPKIQQIASVDAYAKRILLNEYLGQQRRRSWSERPSDVLPQAAARAARPEQTELRLTLLQALELLTPTRRAVVVLRYWEDHSVETVGEMLRMSPAAVKSASLRGLADLRQMLGADFLADIPAL